MNHFAMLHSVSGGTLFCAGLGIILFVAFVTIIFAGGNLTAVLVIGFFSTCAIIVLSVCGIILALWPAVFETAPAHSGTNWGLALLGLVFGIPALVVIIDFILKAAGIFRR